MQWRDVADAVAGVAPIVGSGLAGKAGEAVGNLVASAIGVEPKPGAVLQAIANDPEATAKIRELDVELDKAVLEDRANARAMQAAALTQGDRFSKRFVYYFAGAWSLFAMAYVAAITFLGVSQESVRFADTVLGFVLGTLIASIVQFFFGSSRRDHDRDQQDATVAVLRDWNDYRKRERP